MEFGGFSKTSGPSSRPQSFNPFATQPSNPTPSNPNLSAPRNPAPPDPRMPPQSQGYSYLLFGSLLMIIFYFILLMLLIFKSYDVPSFVCCCWPFVFL